MAAFSRRILTRLLERNRLKRPLFRLPRNSKSYAYYPQVVVGSSCALYIGWKLIKGGEFGSKLPVILAKTEKTEEENLSLLGKREKRFLDFASVEYDGVIYMTPQDFLESVTEENPRPRCERTKLTRDQVNVWLKKIPSRSKGSTSMFRNLHDKGIISYTEYLFLLCVLTKPPSGFGIAFNMFDTDGNKKVDKNEFLVVHLSVTEALIHGLQERIKEEIETFWWFEGEKEAVLLQQYEKQLEKIFSVTPSDSEIVQGKLKKNVWDATTGDIEYTDTTLLVHLFGAKGKDVLKYDDFHNFMDNLQTEVLELEFQAFAKGMPTISEVDFAQILLRYTILQKGEYEEYMQRVRDRVPHEKGISFSEFKQFCQFLNSLDDFALAMRLYTFAEQPVSQDEFQRAMFVCTGQRISPHLLNTVFQIFDIDGDGHLGHEEFISIMKNRLYRGSRSHLTQENRWDMFKACVRNEMRVK